MKACKFCGTQVDNSEQHCPSCGSAVFLHICENCGNQFDSGKRQARYPPEKYAIISKQNCGKGMIRILYIVNEFTISSLGEYFRI